jgi:hypothetical protein
MKKIINHLLIICYLSLFVNTICSGQQSIYYSPADSILYAQFPSQIPFSNDYILFRFRDGGSRMERTVNDVPGIIEATDNIPGHLLVLRQYPDRPMEAYQSSDYGETWNLADNFPINRVGRALPGTEPGQCSMFSGSPQTWILITSNSWQTYDSFLVNLHLDNGDSLYVSTLSYQTGLIYGIEWNTHNLCVSSDTGRTWTIGSPWLWQLATFMIAGAPDEVWARLGYHCYVVMDTGRTVINPVFLGHPPQRQYGWNFSLFPTNHPGEAYLTAYIEEWWSDGTETEIIIYHIRDYGAQVDSSYYHLFNYRPMDVDHPHLLPQEFKVTVFPNPFNAVATLQWESFNSQSTEIEITDILGRLVWQWNGFGNSVHWNGSTQGTVLPSGKYWATIRQGQQIRATVPMILLR